MRPEEEIHLAGERERGARAKALLDSAPFKDAIARVEQGIVQAWKDSPVRDTEGQTYLRLMMKVLADLQGHIREVAETGKLAEISLQSERTLRERAQGAVREFRR